MDDNGELIRKELEEMCRHKWIESEKAGRDVGESACCEWAEKFDKEFVEKYRREHRRGGEAGGPTLCQA